MKKTYQGKKLFLCSSFTDVAGLLNIFEKNLKGKIVTFIQTASKVEKINFYVKDAKKELEKAGMIIDILDISQAEKSEIVKKIRNNDFIYVSGGNIFYLLQEMKKTGADEIIVEEVNNGKLYIGESAGAMIVSENIKYAGLMDDGTEYISELKNLNSLNLVDFYTVPHYGCFPFEESAEKTMSAYSSLNLVPITNNQAILVDEGKIDVLEIKKQKLFSK